MKIMNCTKLALREFLIRAKRNTYAGDVVLSVSSWGVIHSLLWRDNFDILDFFGRPDYWYIDKVVDTGELPQHSGVSHPPRISLMQRKSGKYYIRQG